MLELSDWGYRIHLSIFLFSVFYIRILLTEWIIITGSLSVFLIVKFSSIWFKLAVCYIVSSDTVIFPNFLQGQLILQGTWNKYCANVLMANKWKLRIIYSSRKTACGQTAGSPRNVVKFGVRIIMSILWPAHFLDLALYDFHVWGNAKQTAANQNETIAELKGSLLCFPRTWTHECKLFLDVCKIEKSKY